MNNPLLHHVSEGQGQPLVILHGLFGSSRNWFSLGKRWASDYLVLRIDLRNHGESFHSPDMNYSLMAEDVIALLDSMQLERVHLLGHSMGGKVAMRLCHDYPERVARLVVADISPVAYRHDFEDLIQPLAAMDLAQVHNRSDADKALSTAIPNQQIRQFLLQNIEIKSGRAGWKPNLSALNQAMDRITGFGDISDWKITRPALFIRGARSDYVTDDHWRLIQQHFSQARLKTLPDAGHWLHFEQADLFYQAVSDFLVAH